MKMVNWIARQVFSILTLLTIGSNLSFAQWTDVGNANFSTGASDYISLAFSGSTPYVAFKDWRISGQKLSVMKYNGSTWDFVGTEHFSAGTVNNTSIAVVDSTPYVAFRDEANGGKASVMKYDGSSWVNVGSPGFSPNVAYDLAIDLDGNTPYVAVMETNYFLTVYKFENDSWNILGTANFGRMDNVSFAIVNGVPHIASYYDTEWGILSFNGTSWVPVGSTGVTSANFNTQYYLSFAFDGDTPYIVYKDFNNGNKATVKKYDGENWNLVGSSAFSSGVIGKPQIGIDTLTSTPYVAFTDGGFGYNFVVMKYKGTSWQMEGGSSIYFSGWISFKVNNGIPYVAFEDGSTSKARLIRSKYPLSVEFQNNLNAVAPGSDIIFSFNNSINTENFSAADLEINGSHSGPITGSVSGIKTLTFNPDSNLIAGEIISIRVLNEFADTDNDTMDQPFSWNFTVGSEPADTFYQKTDLGLTYYADYLTTTDIDNDGDVDIIVIERNQSVISGFKNNGNGTFSSTVFYNDVGGDPKAITFSDVDNDGDKDLIWIGSLNETFSVALNNGNGGFASKTSFAAGYGTIVKLADFDNDGDNDLAITTTSDQVKIYTNDGSGTFSYSTEYSTGNTPQSMEFSDLDWDGDLDMTIVNYSSNTVSVFKNNGDATFASKVDYFCGSSPAGLAVADVNLDFYPDLVITNYSADSLSILLNDGAGSFGEKNQLVTGVDPWGIKVRDVDGDNDPDIIVGNYGSQTVSVFKNNGSGIFNSLTTLSAGVSVLNLETIDLNGDGDIDILYSSLNASLSYFSNTKATVYNPLSGNHINAIYNSASTLNGNVTISGTLTANSQINTSSNTIDLGSTGILSGENSTNYIVGKVQSNRTVSSSVSNIAGMGVSIDPQSQNLGNTVIKRETGVPENSNGISQIWTISPTSQPAVPVTVTLSWPSKFDNDINLTNLVVYKSSDGENWSAISATIDKNSDPRTASFSTSSLSIFTIGESIIIPDITDVSPSRNALFAEPNSMISVSFSGALNQQTIDSSLLIVSGSQTGLKSGVKSYESGSHSLKIDPSSDFSAGELVFVSLQLKVENEFVSYEKNNSWAFIVKADSAFKLQDVADYLTGSNPFGLSTADLDLDGNIDIVVANRNDNSLSVFINEGTGSLASKVDYPVGSNPSDVISIDLNADGYLDLVCSNEASSSVSVLLNNRDGTFSAKTDYETGTLPQNITATDINIDGFPDVVSANGSANTISVLVNNGNGTFTGKVDYATDSNPYSVNFGDVNVDGYMDLVTANYGSSNASVFINNGNGTFAGKVDYLAGTNPTGILLSDVNADGNTDLVVTNYGSHNISVLLNTGDGSFSEKVNYSTGNNPIESAYTDFNGDGDPDVVVANNGSGTFSVLTNNGDGSFSDKVDYSAGNSPRSVAVADLDGDGDLDLVVSNSGSNSISLFSNNPAPPQISSVSPAKNASDVSADQLISITFNEEMKSDTFDSTAVIVYGTNTGFYQGNFSFSNGTKTISFDPSSNFKAGELINVTIIPKVQNAGSAKLESAFSWSFVVETGTIENIQKLDDFTTGSTPNGVTIADFNKDGQPDVASSNDGANSISVLINAGSGAFDPKVDYPSGSNPMSITSADLNRDGYLDLITSNYGSDNISVFINNANGTFAEKVDYDAGRFPLGIHAADLDNDGDVDLSVPNYYYTGSTSNNTVSVLKNNGDGTFASKISFEVEIYPNSVSSGDVDGDGDPDLVVTHGGNGPPPRYVTILKNDGSGNFGGKKNYLAGTDPSSVSIADVNGDEKVDLVVSNGGSNTVSVLINAGDSTFAEKVDYPVGSSPSQVVSGDINGDGSPDLAVVNTGSNSYSILENNGDGTFSEKADYTVGSSPKGIAIGDIDNDFDLDIVVTNSGSNSISIFTGVPGPAEIVSVSPLPYSLSSLVNTDVSIEFSVSMNSATLDSNSIVIDGSQTGRHFGSYNYNNSTKTVTFSSDKSFKPGEIVRALVTKNVKNSGNAQLSEPFIWNFSIQNDSTTVYQKGTDLPVGTTPLSGYAADVDNDGDIDLISANSNNSGSISVLINNGDNSFANAVNYSADYSPRSVIAADVNGDGFVDIIASNYGSDNISILINKKDGTFNGAVNYGTDYSPISVTTGDLDSDGDLDLITANYDDFDGPSISILKNNGNGTFAPKSDYGMDVVPNFVTVADVDGEGDLDIITTNNNYGSISILKNDGNGIILSKTDISVGSNPGFVAAGDLNNDQKADLVVANWSSNTVSVLTNVGDSTFAEKVDFGTLKNPSSVQIVDVDGDSDMDILVANAGSDSVAVLKNNGSGSFTQIIGFKVGSSPRHAFAADVDGNSRLDLLSVNSGSNSISVYHGFPYFLEVTGNYPSKNSLSVSRSDSIRIYFSKNLDPSTVTSTTVKVIGSRSGIIENDISYDNTSKSVILKPTSMLHAGENYFVSVLKGIDGNVGKASLENSYSWNFTVKADTGGVFGSVGEYELKNTNSGNFAQGILTASYLNNDQFIDFAIINNNNQISVVTNNGNGGFNERVNYNGNSFMTKIISVDYNNDGYNDLITGSGGKISIYENQGDTSFANKVDISGDWVSLFPRSADLNGDGLLDLMAIESPQSYENVNVLFNTGSETFGSPVTYSSGDSPSDVYINDFNSDGLPDLASANRSGNNLSVLLNDGNGGFMEKVDYPAGAEPYGISGTDFNNDGHIDLVVANASASSISVLLNNGDGTYATKVDYTVGETPIIASTGDLNGDGYQDIAVGNYSSGTISLLINNEDGTFAEKSDLDFSSPTGLEIVDVNGDGSLDILVVSDTRFVTTFMNNTNSNPSSGSYKNITFNSTKFLSGDLNVSGSLFMGDTYLNTNGHTINLGASGSISGETPSNYIVGKIQTTRDLSGPQNNIAGMGISIDPQSNNLGNTIIKRETGTAENSSTIKQIWTITPTNQPTGPVTVTFTWPSSNDNGINLENLVVFKTQDGNNWDVVNATINKDSDPRTATFTVSSFSTFTIGETGSLPVELAEFTAQAFGDRVNLNWSTTTETNNSGWEVEMKFSEPVVERSRNHQGEEEWEKIGFVAGKGTTTERQNYSFSVSDVKANKAEFRLKQIDTDGTVSYSQILSVELKPISFELAQNFPNPFNPVTVIRYQLPENSQVELSVYNAIGQKITTLVNAEQPAGYYSVPFNAAGLSSGIYFYVINAGEFKSVKKLTLLK